MHQERRGPPAGYGRPSGCVAVAASFDTFRDNNTQPIRQGRPRRKLLCGERASGSGERAAVRVLRRQRTVRQLYRLGPRVFDELLAEIGSEYGITIDIEQKIERYAGIDIDALQLAGGDRFPALPIHMVRS